VAESLIQKSSQCALQVYVCIYVYFVV